MILTLHISRFRVGQRFIGLSMGFILLFWNHYGWLGWAYFLLSFISRRLQNNVGISFFKFVYKYFRKNFFDNVEEFRYPNMSHESLVQQLVRSPITKQLTSVAEHINLNSIGFSNKSILIFDENKSSIFSRKNHNWIERKISNSKSGQIVTLKNFTDER